MKKYLLLAALLLSATGTQAQGQLGIKIAPNIVFNRVHASPVSAGFASKGAVLRFKLGAIYDHPFQDNYYVSTGLLYSAQRFAIKNKILPEIQETYALHYLQVPLFLKLYTSEITLDNRLYVVLGFMGQIKVNERNTELQQGQLEPFVKAFRRWGLAGSVGVGLEYDTSFSTSVFAGISYQRGLASVIKQQDATAAEMRGYNDLLSIDLGVRF